jgi:hypothetical protein
VAARRLIFLMLVLLVASSVAAALVPRVERPGDESTTTESTETTTTVEEPAGRLVERTLDAEAKKPQTIRVQTGDRLELLVRSPEVAQVSIPSLGLLENAAPLDPARFDLLLEKTGEHAVRVLDRSRPLGEIVVAAPRPAQPEG